MDTATAVVATAPTIPATTGPVGVAAIPDGRAAQAASHFRHVDGIRGLAALYVVFVHLLPRAYLGETPHGPLAILAKFMSLGHFAVTAFIVISGFCLMLPVWKGDLALKGGPLRFFKRRYLRIAPPLYLAFALSLLMLALTRWAAPGLYSPTERYITPAEIAGHLTLLQTVVPHALLPNNGVLWSITVECLIYLTFPALIAAWRRWGGGAATLAWIVMGYVLAFALRATPLAGATFQYWGAFALGALSAAILCSPTESRWGALRERTPWMAIAMIVFFGLLGACAVFSWKTVERFMVFVDLPVAIGAASLMIGAARQNPVNALVVSRPFAALGLISYSLYMVHYPLADVLCGMLVTPLHGMYLREASICLLVIPLILGLAYLFFCFCEYPFHAISRRAV